jgi:orotidine-5'-phosphate decarboxylase
VVASLRLDRLVGVASMTLIPNPRTIIPACDVDIRRFEEIVERTHDLDGVGAYKIGAALALSAGLHAVVGAARRRTEKPLIYDHQKAATDIPDTADFFMQALKDSGIDAVILFPLSGPEVQSTWTAAAIRAELTVIVGFRMTHDRFLDSEGGYIASSAVPRVFHQAATSGVADFVVPGNRPDTVREIRSFVEPVTGQSRPATYYAPGFITQGGRISEAAQAAGDRWHAIVGRAIFEAPDVRRATSALIDHLA